MIDEVRSWAERWLSDDCIARFVVRRDLFLVWKNERGEALLRSQCGLRLQGGHLTSDLARIRTMLSELSNGAADTPIWSILGSEDATSHFMAMRIDLRSSDVPAVGLAFRLLRKGDGMKLP